MCIYVCIWLPGCLSVYVSVSVSLSVCLSVSVCLFLAVSVCLSVSVCLCLSLCLFFCVCLCLSVSLCLTVCLSPTVCLCPSVCLCLPVSVSVYLCLGMYVSVCLSLCVCVSVCLYICLCLPVSVCLSVFVCLCLYLSVCVPICMCLFVCISVCLCLSLVTNFHLNCCKYPSRQLVYKMQATEIDDEIINAIKLLRSNTSTVTTKKKESKPTLNEINKILLESHSITSEDEFLNSIRNLESEGVIYKRSGSNYYHVREDNQRSCKLENIIIDNTCESNEKVNEPTDCDLIQMIKEKEKIRDREFIEFLKSQIVFFKEEIRQKI